LANEAPPAPPKAKETPRQSVEAVGPSRGPADAPVTLVEFSDFECPFCRRAHDTLEQVLAAYPGKVRLVFRQLPLQMHPHALAAAQASLCAHEQGHFWDYHDALFGRQGHLAPEDLRENAVALGLDTGKFSQCMESGRTLAQVKTDEAAAEKLGLSSTPAFFVNGVLLSGAPPLTDFKRAIDEELGAN
jgi:protein-disulfide isomerase